MMSVLFSINFHDEYPGVGVLLRKTSWAKLLIHNMKVLVKIDFTMSLTFKIVSEHYPENV